MPHGRGVVSTSGTGSQPVRTDTLTELPGVAELSLTRAVTLYWDRQLLGASRRRHVDDLGIGVVVQGQYPASCAVVDLGSTRLKELDLSRELVILGWVRDETLVHLARLLEGDEGDLSSESANHYCFGMVLRVLGEVGFNPLTRATLLRIGYRDLCRDLDPQSPEGIRIDLGTQGIARVGLNADDAVLEIAVDHPRSGAVLEARLAGAFPSMVVARGPARTGQVARYEARMPLPVSVSEVRRLMAQLRAGLTRLVAMFEPARFEGVARSIATFGARDTLARFETGASPASGPVSGPELPAPAPEGFGPAENTTVH